LPPTARTLDLTVAINDNAERGSNGKLRADARPPARRRDAAQQ
jgi:hypothetical protein